MERRARCGACLATLPAGNFRVLQTSSCEMCTRDFYIAHVKPMHLATKSSGELRCKHSSLKLGQVLSCPLDCSSLVLVYAFQKTVGPFS